MNHKTRVVSLLFIVSLLYIVLTSSELGRAEDDNVGNTGAPMENQLCSNCHNSGNGFGTVSLTIQVFQLGTSNVVTSYVPGTLYDMRVTVNHSAGNPAGYGFQMTCLTNPGNVPVAGYSNLGTNVQQVLLTNGVYNGRTYLEQPTMSVSNQFNFRWTAPAAGTGNVRFYAAGNSVNGNNMSSGDKSGNTNLTLPEQLPLAQTNTFSSPTCFGQNNGVINLTVTGGTSPYTFLWNDGAASEDRNNLDGGFYSVTITDALGTSIQQSFTLTEPTELTVNTDVESPSFPGFLGTAGFAISGGIAPYVISIDGIGIVNNSLELPDGVYSWCVTDDNDCSSCGSFEINVPEEISFSAEVQNISCFGLTDGSATVTITGATPPYTIEWSNGDTGVFADSLGAAIHDVFITDAVGYTVLYCVTVDEPALFEGSVSTDGIACYGEAAIVTVDGQGGTGPYTGTGVFQETVGEHIYALTDANGCEAEVSIELDQPTELVLSGEAGTIPCAGGDSEVIVNAAGGTAPYEGTGAFEVNFPGTYQYSVTDANGCTSSIGITVQASDGPTLTHTSNNVLCSYDCDGSIQILLENEIEPFTAFWSDGFEGLLRDELCPGTYSLTYTDGGGCIIVGDYIVSGPPALDLDFVGTAVDCFGNETTVTAIPAGGSGEYTINWNNGTFGSTYISGAGEIIVQVEDVNGCTYSENVLVTEPEELITQGFAEMVTCFGAQDGSVYLSVEGGTEPYVIDWSVGDDGSIQNGLGAGTYTCTVTDAQNCVSIAEAIVIEPEELVVIIQEVVSQTDQSLGSIDVGVVGGFGNYTYQWSNGFETEDIADLLAGTYTFTVTDENSCEVALEIVVDLEVGLTESDLHDSFVVYPNPATSHISVVFHQDITGLEISNETGQVVYESKDHEKMRMIDCSLWSKGIYYIRVISDEDVQVSKFVKD
jgi:hypothetical protein